MAFIHCNLPYLSSYTFILHLNLQLIFPLYILYSLYSPTCIVCFCMYLPFHQRGDVAHSQNQSTISGVVMPRSPPLPAAGPPLHLTLMPFFAGGGPTVWQLHVIFLGHGSRPKAQPPDTRRQAPLLCLAPGGGPGTGRLVRHQQ